jgi:hypothetical protein
MEQRFILEKAVVSQKVKKFLSMYGTRMFIAIFTRAEHNAPS